MKENSIEEDIKDIEKYISFTSKRENFSHDTDWNWNKDLANKIEHILSDYKRVLKENEELKISNKEIDKECSRLEKKEVELINELSQYKITYENRVEEYLKLTKQVEYGGTNERARKERKEFDEPEKWKIVKKRITVELEEIVDE